MKNKILRFLITATLACAAVGVHAEDPNAGITFRIRDLCGLWEYQDAYSRLPDGTTARNFGDSPRGYFMLDCATGRYEHIVMASDLPRVASGVFKQMTNDEAQKIAGNVLAHFGTWTANPAAGRFTVHIIKSSFPNFDGLDQVRVVEVLDRNTLQYKNLQTTNGAGAVVVAKLRHIEPDRGRDRD